MKYNLLLRSDSKKEHETLKKISSKYISIDSLPNKLLNDMIDSYIKHKGYLSISNKSKHFNLSKKIKTPSLASQIINKRINSAKLRKNLTPKSTNINPINSDKKMRETITFKHKNYSAININDNSYNFHQNGPKKIINQDKKLLIYFNKEKEKIKEENEDEKCNITPRYFINEYQNKDIINKPEFSKTTNHFNLNSQSQNSITSQKNNLFQTPNKSDKNFQVTLQHSKSVKNTNRIFLDKKNNRDIEKITSSIKEEVKNYFVKHRFSSVKDYFNDWLYYKRKKDYQKRIYLDEDSIYYYLKEKIGMKIFKSEVNKIFKCNKNFFDINSFKNFFFEENSGRKKLFINDSLLFKYTLFNSYKKFNKNKNIFSSFSDIIKSSKDKMPNFRNNLLLSALKEHKSKIVDNICNNFFLNNKKDEYDYFEFYNLFQNLNIDKKIINKKVIKNVFNKYKKENEKVDIKYFIYNLYRNDTIKNEIFCYEEDNKNTKSNISPNYYNSNPINLHLNKIEFPNKNNSKNKMQINKIIQKNNNNNEMKQKPQIQGIERYKYKAKTPSFKSEINFNKKMNNYNYSTQLNKFMKFSESKVMKKLKKKNLFSFYDTSLKSNNQTSILKANKQKMMDLSSYKTIRIKKKYQANTINNITTKSNIDYNTKKQETIERPISAYSKCLLGINNNNYNNNYRNISNYFENETIKIVSEDTRMQNLNSDIINFI